MDARSPPPFARLGAGLAPGVILAAAYNVARFGSPWELGYQDVGLTTPFLAGAAGLLAHPLKSVVLFAPSCSCFPSPSSGRGGPMVALAI